MAATTHPWTRADLERLPDDGNRYEVLDGVLLVTPQPAFRHQRIALRLVFQLERYCRDHGIGFVVGPGAIPRGKNELQPDAMVVLGAEPRGNVPWTALPRAALVVEVLSSSTRHRDVGVKRAAYLRWGIAEYWVVDPRARTVTAVRPGREDQEHIESVAWQPVPYAPALEIPLVEIFR